LSGVMMMRPIDPDIVIYNYLRTAVVGRAALARTAETVNPGITVTDVHQP
jgi:hypothetical protein